MAKTKKVNKGGRPPKADGTQRDVRRIICLTRSEWHVIEMAARRLQIEPGVFAREAAVNRAAKVSCGLPDEP